MRALNHIGSQALTVSTASVGLTAPTATNPRRALIYVADNPVRWRADGTDPTSTVGMYVAAGSYIDWTHPEQDYSGMLDRVEFIRDALAGGDAALTIAYFD